MRMPFLYSIAILGLLVSPAMAQSSNQSSQGQQQSASSSQQMAQIHAMSQDKLRQSLEQAGFKNVTVVDATYLVRAQSPHGDQVMMLIDPPAAGTASASNSSSGNQQQGQGGSSTQKQ